MQRSTKIILGSVVGVTTLCCGALLDWPCFPTWLQYGVELDSCPSGTPRAIATVSTSALERGREGVISVEAAAQYVNGDSARSGPDHEWLDEAPLRRFTPSAALEVDGERVSLSCDWERSYPGRKTCETELPEGLPDGDYPLHVRVDTPFDQDPELTLTLPLYVPALAHVLTDRPLYEPGDTIQFRSLTLARGTLAPLEQRPGTWTVSGPDGVLLEERSDGGPWGIAESSFPIAANTAPGSLTVRWQSGETVAEAQVQVRPFTLPRFTIEAQSEEPWYGEGDAPVVAGTVRYSSGAPVGDAALVLTLRSTGPWPPPNEWLEPVNMRTDASGNFRWELPQVPTDLVGASGLAVSIQATDNAGDTLGGGARLLLSEDPLAVDAVTELGDGLVPQFNNRVYLRVTSPDGRALADQPVTVRNAWDALDEGQQLTTDEDGVLAMQVDPGQPVNTLVPAQPVRPPPPREVAAVQLNSVTNALRGGATIAERADVERMTRAIEGCAALTRSTESISVGLEVRGGRVARALPTDNPAQACVSATVSGMPLGVGGDGMYSVQWDLQPPEAPTVSVSTSSVGGGGSSALTQAIDHAVLRATPCFSQRRRAGQISTRLAWSVSEGSGLVTTRLLEGSGQLTLTPSERQCVSRELSGLRMSSAAAQDGFGATALSVQVPKVQRTITPDDTVVKGFEYVVAVADLGETRWRTAPGAVPDLRLRPDKVLLDKADTLAIELLRGPDFRGQLPSYLELRKGQETLQRCPRTPEIADEADDGFWSEGCPTPQDDRVVLFTADHEGFMEVESHGGRAVVYVRPEATLSLAMSTDRSSYAPGAAGTLTVQTSGPAVVSLVGVDSTLSALAPLPGPNVLGEVTTTARSDQPAFGLFDALALAQGRVRGEAAAMAAVQRVTVLGESSPAPAPVHLSLRHHFDPEEERDSVFYEVLADARRAVRGWEKDAPDEQLLTNERMAELWKSTLAERQTAGAHSNDAWGREMTLASLTDHQLELVEPRLLVRDATRVPEDIDPWISWVREEMKR